MKFKHLFRPVSHNLFMRWGLITILAFYTSVQTAAASERNDSVAVSVADETILVDSIADTAPIPLPDEYRNAVEAIQSDYPEEWTHLSMQGKLRFEGLPVAPTIKLYMERGRSVILSARAPIVGEVARVEICKDSITFLNKHTKRFLSQNLKPYSDSYPGLISDLQDILLGYVAVPGSGRMNADIASDGQWIPTEGDAIFFIPKPIPNFEDVQFGFLLDPDDFSLLTFALMIPKKESILDLNYLYGDEGWTLAMEMQLKDKHLGGELQLSYPDFNPSPLGFTNAVNYKRTDLRGLLKF